MGGHEILSMAIKPAENEQAYLRSLHKQSDSHLEKTQPCHEKTIACADQNLALFNTLITSDIEPSKDLKDQIEQYKHTPEVFELKCPIKYETTKILEITKKTKKEKIHDYYAAERVQTNTLLRILWGHGIAYNLDTFQCKRLFNKKPYLAQAYFMQYLTLLLEVEPELSDDWKAITASIPAYN